MEDIIQLKITLKGTKPLIWRRILVQKETTFLELHHIIQIAMGWENYHLYQFEIDGQQIAEPDEEYDMFSDGEEPKDASATTLDSMVKALNEKFEYEYDFGDGWQHRIDVEKFLPRDSSMNYPVCTAGKLNCPPEDCGGIGGYYHLLEVLANKKHPEHEEMLEWVGGNYDKADFDMEWVNEELERLEDYIREAGEDIF